MGPTIEVHRLAKTYPGGIEAVKGIGFEVAHGEVLGMLGPNGAGKSTTIGMLTTAIAPTAGTARVGGFDVATHPISARRVTSVVFQDASVDRALTGRRNLEIHARLWGVEALEARRRIAGVADAFGLTDLLDRAVVSYSGGQRRRLEIARALLSQPQVLFLDEPTVGLDPRIRFELLDLIASLRDHADAGMGAMTILLTTHYLDEAERLCDRIAIMHQGRIVGLDTPAALLATLGQEIVELRVGGDPQAALARLRAGGIGGDDAFAVGSTLTVPLHQRAADRAIPAIAELGLAATSISTRQPTLDDVYLRLTGDRIAAAEAA
jgi:ABC-2 type transport system ATP-binding protein